MKVLKFLLVLTPILAIATMLAGILGFSASGEFFFSGFLLAFLALCFCTIWVACDKATRTAMTPVGWNEARAIYPVRQTTKGTRIRGSHYIRSDARARLIACRLHVDKNGVLVEPAHPLHPLFAVGGIFVSWDALVDASEVNLPWYVSLRREVGVEVVVQNTALFLIVAMDAWDEHFASRLIS